MTVPHAGRTVAGPLAVLLFGSLARGDVARGSDVDVLVIDEGDDVGHVTTGKVSVFNYPWHVLLDGAASGDLFVCHVAFEARPLFDPGDRLSQLRAAFVFRSSYADEVARATDLGWFLVRFGDLLAASVVAKRSVWCVRTILIARSAETRSPIFAPAALAASSTSDAGRDLLRRRHARRSRAVLRERLSLFLRDGVRTGRFHDEASFDEFVERFAATGNETALRTAACRRRDSGDYA